MSSGTTSIAVTSAPASSASRASSGPDSSSASRRDTEVEMVNTAVRTRRNLLQARTRTRKVEVRLGTQLAAGGGFDERLRLQPLAVCVHVLGEPAAQRRDVT